MFSGEFNVSADGIFDNASMAVVTPFNGASVDAPAPGPPELALLVLGTLAFRWIGVPLRLRGGFPRR